MHDDRFALVAPAWRAARRWRARAGSTPTRKSDAALVAAAVLFAVWR